MHAMTSATRMANLSVACGMSGGMAVLQCRVGLQEESKMAAVPVVICVRVMHARRHTQWVCPPGVGGVSLLGCCRTAATAAVVRDLFRVWAPKLHFVRGAPPSPAGTGCGLFTGHRAVHSTQLGVDLAEQTIVLRFQVADQPYAACHYC